MHRHACRQYVQAVATFRDDLPWACCQSDRGAQIFERSACMCAPIFDRLRLLSVERDNVAKGVLAYLKGRCQSLEQQTTSRAAADYYHVDPETFFTQMLKRMAMRLRLQQKATELPIAFSDVSETNPNPK